MNVDYKQLYLNQLRYCEELSAKVAELTDAADVARQQAKNATIRCVALEKRVVELDRRVQNLEHELESRATELERRIQGLEWPD